MGGKEGCRDNFLASLGALILTPDTLLMRLSGLDGYAMLAYRGLLAGLSFVAIWLAIRNSDLKTDLNNLVTIESLTLILFQILGQSLFSIGVANAPVSIVLFGVATVPIFASIISVILLGEKTSISTWITTIFVIIGIGLALLGNKQNGLAINKMGLWGAIYGLGVAIALALKFTLIRKYHDLPFILGLGIGNIIAGILGFTLSNDTSLTIGLNLPIIASGIIVLPLSFLLISLASKYIQSAHVSLLLLLETILGPIWVWIGVGEHLNIFMIIGGAMVIFALIVFLCKLALL